MAVLASAVAVVVAVLASAVIAAAMVAVPAAAVVAVIVSVMAVVVQVLGVVAASPWCGSSEHILVGVCVWLLLSSDLCGSSDALEAVLAASACSTKRRADTARAYALGAALTQPRHLQDATASTL